MNKNHTICTYLRPCKAKKVKELESEIKCVDDLKIVEHSDVRLVPIGQSTDEDRQRVDPDYIFEDTGMCVRIERHNAEDKKLENVLYGGFFRHKWGHFITESLSRLWALKKLDLSKIDHILFFADQDNAILSGNFLEVFELLEIEHKIYIADGPISVTKLLVPDLGYEHDRYYSVSQASVYKSIVEAALAREVDVKTLPDKVFLSRAGVPMAARNAVNLNELETYFKRNGYTLLSPEKSSLTELIHIMNGASKLATISGTTAHNFAFVQNMYDKEINIIERHAWVNSFQISLNLMLGVSSVNIDGFYLPRPASAQDSLMLFAPTPQFRNFARDSKLTDDGLFVDDKKSTRRRELRRFLTRYRRYWCSGNALCAWEIESGVPISEAIVASKERYEEWISKALPLMWYDYLTPRAVVRAFKMRFSR